MIKYKIFQRLLILLILMLVPTTILFAYANRISEKTVRETLENSASKQLEFTIQQLEQSLRQIETSALLLVNDTDISAYAGTWNDTEYVSHLLLRNTIEEKLVMQSQANKLIQEIKVYWPSINEMISTTGRNIFQADELAGIPRNKWFARHSKHQMTHHLLFTNPTIASPGLESIVSAVEITLSGDYLRSVLQGLDASGNGKSLIYIPGATIISNHDVEYGLLGALDEAGALELTTGNKPNLTVLELQGVDFLVQTIQSHTLDATIVSYIQLNEFLHPLKSVKLLVACSLLFLFLTGIFISYTSYLHFRLPFSYLVRRLESLGEGDITIRATIKVNNEFDYLFDRFNDMAGRIQSLIENVYEEKVRTKEAEYKHLQSQINPHFLYNCLFYIVSMANKSPDAVIMMAKNLSGFYRYITKKAGGETTLEDEIQLVESYLKVQSLRNKRLRYHIDIPTSMSGLHLPTLLLQPLVENAVVHGLERKHDARLIQVTGYELNGGYVLTVSDDGAGMNKQELDRLNEQIRQPHSIHEIGCGLWNVHQRLTNRYGANSGLMLKSNEYGGLDVTLTITAKERVKEHEPADCG